MRSLAFRANKLSWIVCGKVYLNSAPGKTRESSGKRCGVFFVVVLLVLCVEGSLEQWRSSVG